MSNEFYNYIANNTLCFFQGKASELRPGERYCLKLDNEEMVQGVDLALRTRTAQNHIQGSYSYKDVYTTFTILLSEELEVVVASKINGMTDDFLATLRNAELTSRHYPIIMITHSAIDTITSGTGDLSANGMPFHVDSIIGKIKTDIQKAQLSIADKTLLEVELERKQTDRFSDKSSLYEYGDILTVLGRGIVVDEDYREFSLIFDPESKAMVDVKKIRERLKDNHSIFERIEREFKHGNITDNLGSEFDKSFVEYLSICKRKNIPWYHDQTYAGIKASQDRLKRKLDNPLQIENSGIEAYSGTPIQYQFVTDETLFVRDDGSTKTKQRKKNILLFNPDQKDEITISICTNITIRTGWIECTGGTFTIAAKKILITVKPTGCTFVPITVKDLNNNITYFIKACVVNILPRFLENIQTAYVINLKRKATKGSLQIFGITQELVINPNQEHEVSASIIGGDQFECAYNQTLRLKIGEEDIDTDTGYIDCILKFGSVIMPIQIQDEAVKPTEMTGIGVFKWKHNHGKSLEYRDDNKIVAGTTEYFARDPFKSSLELESLFVKKGWLGMTQTIDGYQEYDLLIPNDIKAAYFSLIQAFKDSRTLPSLGYYKPNSVLYYAARNYVDVVEHILGYIEAGQTLPVSLSNIVFIGCVMKNFDERTISMGPLHPLNVLYQLQLLDETLVGDTRENLIEKLTPLYLLPYIKDTEKNLYHAVEQKHSPEWRYYAPISQRRYQGARIFVQKLVCDKIIQYKEHFAFLFDDIDNNQLHINLINMGDCREIFQGLVRFYIQSMEDEVDPDNLLNFVINIYSEDSGYNDFSLLADQRKLRDYLGQMYSAKEVEDVGELALILTGRVHFFLRKPQDPEYKYAHLTFYEMSSSEDTGASRMDSITTGVSLGGLVSGTPSVLNAEWYKTGFGTKYATKNQLTRLASYYNALCRVAYTGSSYEPRSSIFTEIVQGQEGLLGKIYRSSNWVVFVDPKVDLSFFQKKSSTDDNLMIIHYSDQYTSASGYDDITVTQKSEQFNDIIIEQLQKKGVAASNEDVNKIISLFNAVNGGWMLRLITAKKLTGATDSYFSREKMSILSAIKLCMAYYSHPDIVWIPISLEEMLRVSGGAGLSQKDGLLSAKNLGFEQRVTSDDILLVGIEGPEDDIKVYLHPVEVKIGQNSAAVLAKAKTQLENTYHGLWNALWPQEGRNDLERKLTRNFFMQLILVCCEKMKLYGIYPDDEWDNVLATYRENLLNERYVISASMDFYIGRGTIVSFGTDVLSMNGSIDDNNICLLEMPEKLGSSYMVMSAKEIENELNLDDDSLPQRLKTIYSPPQSTEVHPLEPQTENESEIVTKDNDLIPSEPSLLKVSKGQVTVVDPNQGSIDCSESINMCEINNDTIVASEGIQLLFGTDITSGEPLMWCPNDTNQIFHANTGIIGTMGTGKTQFTKSMIAQLYLNRGSNFGADSLGILIFDYKGDYNESKEDFIRATNAKVLKPYHLQFNPLALTKSKIFKPLLPIHTANAFKDTLSKVYGLGPKQQNTLFQCIIDAYAAKGIIPGNPSTWDNTPPTFDMVYSLYTNNDEIKKTDSLAAAMDKLYQFQVFEGNPKETKSLFELLDGVVVIDLSGYDTDIQSLIVAITLDLFYAQMQAAGSSKMDRQYRQLTKIILVDEADNFISEGFPTLKKILKEGREFGVGTILSTQFLKHFGTGEDDYSKYILTWVVHNVADLKNSDVEFVFQTEAKSQESQTLYSDIKSLKKHHSIVKIGNAKPKYIEDKAFWELYKDICEE